MHPGPGNVDSVRAYGELTTETACRVVGSFNMTLEVAVGGHSSVAVHGSLQRQPWGQAPQPRRQSRGGVET